MRTLLMILIISACSRGNQLGEGLSSELDAVRALARAHHESVTSASSTDEVADLEATYDEDYDATMMDMSMTMDSMMGCMEMGDGDWMDGMQEHMDEMSSEHDDHVASQAGCADMETCMAPETAHLDGMMEHLDAMDEEGSSWDEGMSCGGMDDEGMMM